MPPDSFVIINADDFGWTEGINNGIVHAHRKGILTSATLLANASATSHAIALAKTCPDLSIGVHLAYQLGKPILPIDQIDALYDKNGQPRLTTPGLWIRAGASKKIRNQLHLHFRSQVQYVRDQGIAISHLDTHKHLHYWPGVFRIVAKIAADFQIPAIRLIKEYPTDPGPTAIKSRTALTLLGWTSLVNRRIAARHRLKSPDRFVGIIQTGLWTKAFFMDIIRTLKPGVTEIMVHPGYTDGLEPKATRLIESRRKELEILTYPTVKENFQLCQSKNKLINYHELDRIK